MCAITGRSTTGTIGFGISYVSGRRRVPRPAARTMAFMRRRNLANLRRAPPAPLQHAGDDDHDDDDEDDQADEAEAQCSERRGQCECECGHGFLLRGMAYLAPIPGFEQA